MEGQSRVGSRLSSGIPRPVSRLPLPTSSTSKSIRPSPSRERLRADPGLDDRRLRRPSYESLLQKPRSHYSPAKPRPGKLPKQEEVANEPDDVHSPEGSPPAKRDDVAAYETRGRTRPSLSERTIETLSSIPPSPVSVKRQNSFFNGASPIRSPSRTPSNVSSYSRSPSRSSSNQASNDLLVQPVSKLRLPSRSRMSVASSSGLPGGTVDADDSATKMPPPPKRQSIAVPSKSSDTSATPKKPTTVAKSNVRPSPRSSSKSSLSSMGPPERPLQVRKTRKTPADSPSSTRSPSTTSRYVSAASSLQDDLTPEQQAENESRKASKSSSTLRDTIARAKAAKKAAAMNKKEDGPDVPTVANSWDVIDTEDPFNQLPKGSNANVLRKRVDGARTSGTLNIAALSLTEIPEEVISMYVFDPEKADNWFENVDLVKFIAADNDLAEIADAVFPDMDLEDVDPDSDERGPQFGGLESLDLHGNVLRSLPLGLRRLHQLRFLNLSNNDLRMEDLSVVMEIPSLSDLKLANNKLQGSFSKAVGNLRNLESLDLRGNAITLLPTELGELTRLKTLEVGENQLTSLPFEALSKLPLITLSAPKNKLDGTLIPSSVNSLDTLQTLNIAHNLVEIFADNEKLSLPNLHSLFIGINRIRKLPSLSSWQSLLTLSAEDNNLTELPVGFVDLKKLKSADFTGNNITRLDERIGFMDTLSLLRVANNPLVERKLLNMETEDIKRDMQNRCEPEPQETDDEGSVATQFTDAPEIPTVQSGWKIKSGGVLDRSHSDLKDLDVEKLSSINVQDVRCLYLQHNELSLLPVPALEILAQGLVELDLSNNPLGDSHLLSSALELPKLQTLNLSAAGLTTLENLLTHVKAPSLTLLDVSKNRLTGDLPNTRQTFPNLKSFIVADNKIIRLEFEAVQGLQALDVSNNDIESLPPKIALRRFEVSGNRFRVPRWQIVAKGTAAILEYLREHIPVDQLPEWEHEAELVDAY
ncbi:hypothetical protein N7468_006407 [Penicillium chermesinum]|uniref:Uncharacterized protein n=1 Tax=Penicillium chermesinum TaxID=63820 RepID=A0A9W9TJJ1_9EURO|nr:uncharacterized protein N7468_006407 [Penicillium chermesinum]KAJ5225182.1 hypothetical protein N7468_006407 [Penicillium chermesinum]